VITALLFADLLSKALLSAAISKFSNLISFVSYISLCFLVLLTNLSFDFDFGIGINDGFYFSFILTDFT